MDGHIARIEEIRNRKELYSQNLKGRGHLQNQEIDGDNIIMDVIEIVCEYVHHSNLVPDRVQWRACMNT
jgi:hypothetical protein